MRRTFGSIVSDGNAARGDIAALWGVWDITEGDALGEAVSNLKIRHVC